MASDKNNKSGEGFFATIWRWIKRTFWVRGRDLDFLAAERLESPSKTVFKRFMSRRLCVVACIILAFMFALSFIGPLFFPSDLSYMEISQMNIPPGYNLLNIPKALQGNVKDISAGPSFNVGLDTDGNVYVWGNKTKMTKTVDLKNIPDEVKNTRIVKVAAGTDHILALSESGKIYGWGINSLGQYGDKPASDGYSIYNYWPAEVSRGFSSGADVAQIVAANQVSAIVLTDGRLYVWGNIQTNCSNAAAMRERSGEIEKVAFTQDKIIAIAKDGSILYDGAESYSRIRVDNSGEAVETDDVDENGNPIVVEQKSTRMASVNDELRAGRRAVDIAATMMTCAVVLEDGEVLVSGSASRGEKDLPDILTREAPILIEGGRYHYTALTASGSVVSWGSDYFNQSSPPANLGNVKTLCVDYFHNYAIDENGTAKSWGLKGYILGTDDFGRDLLGRIVNGGKMTMTIGAVAVIVSTIIGLIIGCAAGYFGGWIDMLLMRITEVISSLPFIPFALILSAVVRSRMEENQRIFLIMIVLGVLSWPPLARLARAQILGEREKEFVVAAQAMGVKESKIALKHILPNIISVILVSVTLDFAGCLLTESTLSYLGFGVSPPQPTWGNMLMGCNNSTVIQSYWWRWVFPSIALALCTISINIIGDGLRDAVDPKSGER